jgi:hypothetical protein
MDTQPLNRFVVIALALPAAILIAAFAAILDYVFPRGSWVNFLATMLPMGLVIAGVMAGFAAACERCERRLDPIPEKAACEGRAAGRPLYPIRGRFGLAARNGVRLFRHVGDCGHS